MNGDLGNMDYNQLRAEYIFGRLAFLKKVRDGNFYCNSREALHGGRTNNLKFGYKVRRNEKILYYDFTSLYPYVLANRQFPLGHPEVITYEFEEIENYFGLVRCKVLPLNNYISLYCLSVQKES
jgi:hypothetical protein